VEFPLQPILFLIPSLTFIIIQKIRKQDWSTALINIGWQLPPTKYIAVGLGFGLISGLFSFFISNMLPQEVFGQPGIAQSFYSNWSLSVSTFFLSFLRETIYVALGEEIFFRGFLGGILYRKLGFMVGNIIQSIVFLLPHLLLLTVSIKLWPILIAQFIGGWLFGWLCYKSESILSSWLAHALSNAFGAIMFMN
jgi:membrane protease YdiL (CAAX protease family)